ncbi:MAG: WXG100 family type VII secretion target [Veillonellaceae bacterium]|nr:WXG100 family type VII secretion target [Veillonellaceae bacterium]
MDQIKVNTGDLQTSAQELDSVVNDITTTLNQLSNNIGNAYEGQLKNALEGIIGDVHPKALQLQNRSRELSDELVLRAKRFEAANESGNIAMINVSHQLNDFLDNSPILKVFRSIGKSDLGKASLIYGLAGFGFGALAGLVTLIIKIRTSIINRPNLPVPAVDVADAGKDQDRKPFTGEQAVYNTAPGKPKHSGTLGLHNNARDYESSTDPGKTGEDQQRKRIKGREIRAYERGRLEWISFDDEKNQDRIKHLEEVQKNPRGITLQISYPESGYTVKYTHIVPSERLLSLLGISESELATTKVKPAFKDAWVEPGEVIGCYNQIGWSTGPHLHLATYKGIGEDKIGIDPDTTDIPQRTLF